MGFWMGLRFARPASRRRAQRNPAAANLARRARLHRRAALRRPTCDAAAGARGAQTSDGASAWRFVVARKETSHPGPGRGRVPPGYPASADAVRQQRTARGAVSDRADAARLNCGRARLEPSPRPPRTPHKSRTPAKPGSALWTLPAGRRPRPKNWPPAVTLTRARSTTSWGCTPSTPPVWALTWPSIGRPCPPLPGCRRWIANWSRSSSVPPTAVLTDRPITGAVCSGACTTTASPTPSTRRWSSALNSRLCP